MTRSHPPGTAAPSMRPTGREHSALSPAAPAERRPALRDTDHLFRKASFLAQTGRLHEAEQLYENIVRLDGTHFGSLHQLGLIRAGQNRFDDALELLRKAIEQDPNSADAHVNIAVLLEMMARADEAVAHCERALAIRPDCAEAHFNAGNALKILNRPEDAIAHYEKAIAIKPRFVEAYYNLGNTLSGLKRYSEARAKYDQALAIKPRYSTALNNRGIALQELKQHEEAINDFDKALAIAPNDPDILNNRGNSLAGLRRFEEALSVFDQALVLRHNYATAWYSRGNVLLELRRYPEALADYDRALAIRPDYVDALNNRGNVLLELEGPEEALASFESALALDPDHPSALSGAARLTAGICDWTRTSQISQELITRVEQGGVVAPFIFLAYCGDPALQFACAKRFASYAAPALSEPLWNGEARKRAKIRIAYLSAGFHLHPNSYLTAELYELHDRSRFEVLGISIGPDDGSDMRARLIRAFDEFHDVRSMSDRDAAKLIHDLQVDVVIDRSGYITDARPGILAYRPAPIQVNYLGYPGTLGADFYDYIIADPIVLPFDQHIFYTEKIVHLPDCYQSNDSKRVAVPETPTRPEAGLPSDGFVFCCFNSSNKITPTLFDIWMRLLQQVDGSVLWLLRNNSAAERNLREEATLRGIDPVRLIFADRTAPEQHLARHRLADLFLDTLPYNAHTTASDALRTGLPLVTCLGESFQGRVAASILHAAGLSELVTRSLPEYEALAARLATDPSLLRAVGEKLRKNRETCALFDTDRYRRHIETAYTTMWQIWQMGEAPRSFGVEQARKPG